MRDYGALIWQLFLIYLLAWKLPIGGTVQYRPALTINFFTICKHVCTGYLASYLLNAPIRVLVPYTWHSTKSSAAEYTLIMPMLWPNSATEPWGLNQWKRKNINLSSLPSSLDEKVVELTDGDHRLDADKLLLLVDGQNVRHVNFNLKGHHPIR